MSMTTGLTENTRACYPIDFIPNADLRRAGALTRRMVVMPDRRPPSGSCRRSPGSAPRQAMYHLPVGGTPHGSRATENRARQRPPKRPFSTCFWLRPSCPAIPAVYAKMLGAPHQKSTARNAGSSNTGWSGGTYGVGKRNARSPHTRGACCVLPLDGPARRRTDAQGRPIFGDVGCPRACPEVPSEVLDPRGTWSDKQAL